MDFSYAMLDF